MKEKSFTLTPEQRRGILTLMVWLPKTTNPKINITDSADILRYIFRHGKYHPSEQMVLNELRTQYYKEVKNEELITW